jgi:RND family efflux transporter MFP subunit
MVILEASDVTKVFEEGSEIVSVLKGASLTLERGEIVALEGPSGSGKTTFLTIVGCMLTPSSGRLIIEGREIDPRRLAQLPRIRKASIGFVFQQFNLFPALTAAENVEYALNLKGWRGLAARRETGHLLEAVGLIDRRHFLPRDLSGGQKQRVAIARALARPAPILLADEVTANLDFQTGARILDLFRRLAKREDRALLIVTHDPKVRGIADRVVRIHDGVIMDSGNRAPRIGIARALGPAEGVESPVVGPEGGHPIPYVRAQDESPPSQPESQEMSMVDSLAPRRNGEEDRGGCKDPLLGGFRDPLSRLPIHIEPGGEGSSVEFSPDGMIPTSGYAAGADDRGDLAPSGSRAACQGNGDFVVTPALVPDDDAEEDPSPPKVLQPSIPPTRPASRRAWIRDGFSWLGYSLLRLWLPASGLFLAAGLAWQSGRLDDWLPEWVPPSGAAQPSRGSTPVPPPTRLVAEGRVVAYPGAEVVVGTDLAGLILRMPVQEKSAVRRGDLIAEIRSDDLRAYLVEAKARIAEVEADIQFLERELRREELLLARRASTPQALDADRRAFAMAHARLAAASATKDRYEVLIAKARIVSPIDGVIIAQHAQPGETVEAATRLVTIADLSRVRIEAEVDEFDAAKIALGARATIMAEGFGSATWRGTIEEISDTVVGRRIRPEDPSRPIDTRVLPVKIALNEPTPLRLGQRVEVEIATPEAPIRRGSRHRRPPCRRKPQTEFEVAPLSVLNDYPES